MQHVFLNLLKDLACNCIFAGSELDVLFMQRTMHIVVSSDSYSHALSPSLGVRARSRFGQLFLPRMPKN